MDVPYPPSWSPAERLKAYREARTPQPEWEAADFIDGAETCLPFFEEAVSHPENRPLLCLCNTDEAGTILGEIWFAPADIPAMIEFLRDQLRLGYASRERRWLGQPSAPPLYFGEVPPERREALPPLDGPEEP
jgi:hypothetical protein